MTRLEFVQWSGWMTLGGMLGAGMVAVATLMAIFGGYLLAVAVTSFMAVVLAAMLGFGIGSGARRTYSLLSQSMTLTAFSARWARASDRSGAAGSPGPAGTMATADSAEGAMASGFGEAAVAEAALREVDIFRNLSAEQRAQVASLGRLQELQQGEILGVQGSSGDALYVLLDGQAELVTASPVGQLTVRVAGAGESLPLAAVLGDGTLITTALALSDLRALVIPRAAFLELCGRRPDIGQQVFRTVAEILALRYQSTLRRLTQTMDRAFEQSELWANV